ncbi:MAG: glycosyltransferase family 25 protein [Rhodobacteraceae bacterium]|jgi:glycosyl transferase family 25|nr:glycosyltransferase family 25 protein [Paracoccaceae bacterium]
MTLPVYIIALSDRPGGAALRDRLGQAGVAAILHPAVDGRRGLPRDQEARVDRIRAARVLGRPMGDAEFACALSHQDVYARILAEGHDAAVVLEEDAIPSAAFVDWCRAAHPLPADLVLLDHRRTYVQRRPLPRPLVPGVPLHRVLVPPFLTTGYAVTRNGAAYLARHSLPISHPADWPCDILPLRPLACVPPVVGHPDKTQSTIEAARRVASGPRLGRFASPAYWRRWWGKRVGLRVA